MSDAQGPGAIAEQIEDFEHLYPRQTGINRFSVLNARKGTAYAVNVADMECECDDAQYNGQGGRVCKHVQVALYQAPKTVDVDQHVLDQASSEFKHLQQAVQSLEQTATAQQAQAAAQPAGTEPAGPDPEELAARLTEAWKDNGFEIERSTIEDGEVHFELGHEDFDMLKKWTSKVDVVGYNGEYNFMDLSDVETYLSEVA